MLTEVWSPEQGSRDSPLTKAASATQLLGGEPEGHLCVDLLAVGMYKKEKRGVELKDKIRNYNREEEGRL